MIIDASRLFISRSTTVVSTAESRLTAIGQSILDNVQTIPSHVQGVMKWLPERVIVPVREWDIQEVIVCESFRSLGVEGCSFTPADALTIQYIGEFVEQLVSGTLTPSRSSMIQNPYVVDQLKTGDYQTAGDTAVYGYFFLQERRRQQLTAKDYLHMASQSYLRWYGKQPTSIGYLLSERVERYLPVIQKVLEHTFPKIAPPLLRLV